MATDELDAAISTLPDELLLDIFRLLPDPVDLLRCAATCRRWLRAVAADNAAFLRRAGVLPKNKISTILLGAFYQNDYPTVPQPTATEKNSDCPPMFWRLHTLPPADDLDCPGLSILPNPDGLFNYAKPLASRRGLLLVRLMLDDRKLHLAVCHPLLGGVHLVPPPPLDLHPPLQVLGRKVTGYALLTGSHRSRPLAFQVLLTAARLDGAVYAYSYSSATGSWSAPTMCPLQLRKLTMSGPLAGVVDGDGTAHWLYRDETSFYTLDVTARAARVSLTKLPEEVQGDHLRQVQPIFPCIAGGGKMAFAFSTKAGHATVLKLWNKRRDQDEHWTWSVLAVSYSSHESFEIVGFAESRGAILFKSNSGLYCFDIESRELELVRGSKNTSTHPTTKVCPSCSMCEGYRYSSTSTCSHCAYNDDCVHYEIDWSSYLLHLSAWRPRISPHSILQEEHFTSTT